MKLHRIVLPVLLLLVGFVLVVLSLQLMTSEFLMVTAVAILGIGGLSAIYGAVWLAEMLGDHLRERRQRGTNALSRTVLGVPRDAWSLYAILVLTQAGYSVLVPILAALQQEFGLSYAETSLAWAVFGISRLVVDLPAGPLIVRHERKRLLAVAILIGVVGLVYGTFAPSFEHFVASRVIFGFSSSLATATLLAWLIDIAEPSNRGRVLGFQESGWSFVSIVVPLIGGLLATAWNWRVAVAFSGICCLCALLFLLPLPQMRTAHTSVGTGRSGPSLGAVFRVGGAALVASNLLAFVIFMNRNGFVGTFTPLFGGSVLGLQPAAIGAAAAVYHGTSLIAVTLAGPLMDRIGKYVLVIPALLLTAVGDLLLLFVTGFPGYAFSLGVIGLNAMANPVTPALIGDLLPRELRPMATAVYRFVADFGILVAPLAVGFAFDLLGAQATIVGAAATVTLCLVAFWLLIQQHRRSTSPSLT